MTYDVIQSLSAAINKNKSQSVKTIIKSSSSSALDPVLSTSDITNNGSNISLQSSASSSNSSSLLLDPICSSKSSNDIKKKTPKTPRKHSAPIQPKSGALAAAMMAATVAGGSGFLDARKGIQEESSRSILRAKKSKASIQEEALETPAVPIPSATVNVPSKLADSVTLEQVAENGDETKTTSTTPVDPHAPPADFNEPSGPVACQCDNHLDKLEAEIEVPISAKHLYYIMFAEGNSDYMDIWEKKTVENKSKELTMTSWENVDGKRERTLKYIIPVNNAMVKLKEAEVVEKQILEKKEDHL